MLRRPGPRRGLPADANVAPGHFAGQSVALTRDTTAAEFGALSDDRVDAALFKQLRLGDGRGAGDNKNPCALDGVEDLLPRKAEVEAHHLRLHANEHRQ